jgi:outer membrane protein assembly factor BamB
MVGPMRHAAGRGVSVLLAAAAVVLLLLPGCWLQIGAGPGHTRYSPIEAGLTVDNVSTLQEVWSVAVPGVLSEPMVSEGRVFVTRVDTFQSGVRAVDAGTGGTLWDTGLVSVPPVSGAFAAGTPVTFVGDRLWTGFLGYVPFAPGRPVPGPACALGSVVLDPTTGAKGLGVSAFPSAAASAAPVVARALFSVPTPSPCSLSDTTITLEVTGSPGGEWRTTIPGLAVGSFTPTLTSNRVLLTHGSSLDAYAIDGCTENCLRWTRTLSPEPSTPVIDGTGPIFVTSGPRLVALDPADGAELWRAPLPGNGAGVAVANGTVYVTSTAGTLQAFDAGGCGATTCGHQWGASFDFASVSEPVVGGGVVYVADGNSIVAFDAGGCGATTCAPLADVAVSGGGRLSLAGGRLFIAGNGRLTALAPE